MPDFIPRRDVDLLNWSRNFSNHLLLDPGAFAVSPEQAAAYAQRHAVYAAALARTVDSGNRSQGDVILKDEARAALVSDARALARQIRAQPTVTAALRVAIRLTVDKEKATPIGPPSESPRVSLMEVVGNRVRIQLMSKSMMGRRGKPAGVIGAEVFGYVGHKQPESAQDWVHMGCTSRTRVELVFGSHLAAGSRVWVTARWLNPRLQHGPSSTSIFAHLGFCGGLPGQSLTAAA
jgi:hypothetical protein